MIRNTKWLAPVIGLALAGQASAPSRVTLSVGGAAPVDLQFFFDEASGVVTVKKPDVKVTNDWTITLAPR